MASGGQAAAEATAERSKGSREEGPLAGVAARGHGGRMEGSSLISRLVSSGQSGLAGSAGKAKAPSFSNSS